MTDQQNPSLTPIGRVISFLLVVGLLAFGGYVVWSRMQRSASTPQSTSAAPSGAPQGNAADPFAAAQARTVAAASGAADVNTRSAVLHQVPSLGAAGTYQMKDNTLDIELSHYLGYAGIIAANNGLAPTEDSIFFKKHGFKVRIGIKEEESRDKVHTGQMAAVATTADVLACFGRQFNVVVPVQIGYSRGADAILVTTDINRINQLKGKVLAGAQFTESEFFLRYLAQEAGLGVVYINDLNDQPDPEKINLFFSEDAFAAGDLFLKEVQSGKPRLAGCVSWAPKTTEVVKESSGKAKSLVTNQNLLLVGDILVVNKPFAKANPKVLQGLVEGLLEGNHLVRANPEPYLDLLMKAFNADAEDPADKLDRARTREELGRVHLSNLPENLAFFTGDISTGGSFASIYASAVLQYGSMVRDPVDADHYADIQYLKAAQASPVFAAEVPGILPIKSSSDKPLEQDPLLSKDIRFYFEPNSSKLELNNPSNTQNLQGIVKMLQVSPGSKVLLRGHVDNARVAEFRKMGGEQLVGQQALSAMQLSKQRAVEVKKQLVDSYKTEPTRVDTLGRGWEEPAGTDSDKNRRVEVYWYTLE